MGEIAEMMLDGTLYQVCGGFIGSDNGFPISCIDCLREEKRIPDLIQEIEDLSYKINEIDKKTQYITYTHYWRYSCLDVFYWKNGYDNNMKNRKQK